MTSTNSRTADYPIDPIFLERWSPRAFNRAPIMEAEILTMFEAGRWAASSYNSQPWRFIYARRNTPHWDTLFGLLVPFNQSWAESASALVFLVSKTTMPGSGSDQEVPSYTHSLDAGTASANFVLQANRMGWFVHGMSGFDVDRSYEELGVPEEGYRIEAAYAIGKQGDKSQLPEMLQQRESPSNRLPLSQLAFEGRLGQ